MANRFKRGVRPVIAAVAALGAAAMLVPSSASATPDPADPPTIASVQQQLGELALQNTQLVEKFDQAKQDVIDKQAAAKKARSVAANAQTRFLTARKQLVRTVAAQYESGSFSATGALLQSSSNQNYLDQLTTLQMLSDHTSQVVGGLDKAQTTAANAEEEAAALLAQAKHTRAELAKKNKHVQAQVTKYTDLLAKLNAAQRRAYLERMTPQVSQKTIAAVKKNASTNGSASSSTNSPKNAPTAHASSAAAQKAVQFALAQVGKPYVFGAAGPNSYDCSGLTMDAWAAAGVSLPHSALRQYNYGHHVSFDQLQPGDLLFFYRPIGHVTIYAGDGMMVSAPQSGQNVSVIPATVFGSDYVGATRLVD